MVEPDSLRHCCTLHSGGGTERHQLGGTLPSWWEIKDGSDTGCQNNNGALTVRCVVLLSVGLLCCVFVSAIFVVSPKPCATVFPPPYPVTSGFLCLCDGDQHATFAWARAGGERSDAQDGRHEHIWSVDLPPPLPIQAQGQLQFGSHHDARQLSARRRGVQISRLSKRASQLHCDVSVRAAVLSQ